MNFLADESCARTAITTLRETGHDVVAIAEVAKGATDEQVLERAANEKRVLITEDRDFGETGPRLRNAFTVVEPGRVRISGRP